MNYTFSLIILFIGLSGIVAQVVLLRELLVSFYGNELTIGVILANWILSEALGVFLIGKFIDKVRNKINVFIGLQVIFSFALPVVLYLSRTFKTISGIPFGEGVALPLIFFASLIIILPVAFCHGALFSVCSSLTYSIGRMYIWETLGTITGGLILAYLFIPYLNSFQIIFFIAGLNLVIAINFISPKKIKYLALLVLIFAGLFLNKIPDYLEKYSIEKQWRGLKVLDYKNSVYGNVCVTKNAREYTFFYNGIPVITTPFPDRQFVEELGNLPLLFHQAPKDIMIASAGAGGLIHETLKYPIKSLDYVEIDPLIIGMLKKYPTALTKEELGDKRVAVINTDPRLFLSSSQKLYDLIIIGLSNQADLSTNRLFTQEFFVFAKTKLNPDGILAFWLPGSLTYLSEDLKNLNKCIINALTPVYSYLRVIPEDYNIFIASDSKSIMEAEPALISQRIKKGKIPVNILIPAYLEYRLSREKQDWFNQELAGVNISANRDLRPVGVYNSLLLWNKKFPSSFTWVLNSFKGLNLKVILGCIFLLTILLFYIFRRAKNNKPAIAYSIASTGFFGMLSNLILIFSYQVFFGSLYYKISILISIFMAGIALGSLLIIKSLDRIKIGVRLLLIFEAMIMLFSLVLPIAIIKWPYSYVFYILLLFSGLFMGLEFPLAAKIYSQDKAKSGETSGMLYAADLTGGWLAGIFTGVVFLPILGVLNSCILVAMLKLSSFLLLALAYLKKNNFLDKH